MRRLILCVLLAGAAVTGRGQELKLPMKDGSTRFAVIGDGGTGGSAQQRVADRLAAYREVFPFEFAIMLGDNLYGSERPRDYERKFERPYKPLLDAGVKFYASLGNHDDPPQRFYKLFNMGGARYYTFRPARGVRFFALDSNYMDQDQLDWLERELAASASDWKICFFHHPLYSSGARHGSEREAARAARTALHPARRRRGLHRPRAFLRAAHTPAEHSVLRRRQLRQAAARQPPEV